MEERLRVLKMEPQITSYKHLLTWAQPELVTDKNYEKLCAKLERLMTLGGTNPKGAIGKMVDLLSRLLSDYEADNFTRPNVSGRELLEHIIESRGETRASFARAMSVRPQVISNILNGHREISKALALKLGSTLHMQPGVFLES